MPSLDDVTRALDQHIERRRFLRRMAAFGLGLGALLASPLRSSAGSNLSSAAPRVVNPASPDALRACRIFCYLEDCCTNCCGPNPAYELYKCYNNCDSTYFYACADHNCQGFCYSFDC